MQRDDAFVTLAQENGIKAKAFHSITFIFVWKKEVSQHEVFKRNSGKCTI